MRLIILQIWLLAGLASLHAASPTPPAGAAQSIGAASLSDIASAVFDTLEALGSKQFSSAAQLETYLEAQAFDNAGSNPSVGDWVDEYETAVEDLVGGSTKIGDLGYAKFIKSWQTNLGKPGEPASFYDAVDQIFALLNSGGSTPIGKYSLPDGYSDHLQWLYKNGITNMDDVNNLLQQMGNKQGYLPVTYDANGSTFNTGSGSAADTIYNKEFASAYSQLEGQTASNLDYLYDSYSTFSKNTANQIIEILQANETLSEEQQQEIDALQEKLEQYNAQADAAAKRYNEIGGDSQLPEEGALGGIDG